MLETLISSRIRRTLLEHLLAHPEQRCYLRGLARELALSVSPLRRELKRLEAQGLLKAYQEANIRFYIVDRAAPLFSQLTAALRSSLPAPARFASQSEAAGAQAGPATVEVPQAPEVEVIKRRIPTPVAWKTAMEAVALSLVVAGVLTGVAYLAYTNQRLLLVTKHAVLTPKTQVTVVESPHATASGAMRGTRWQLVPGSMGGLSGESY